jgi:hypothetical protein
VLLKTCFADLPDSTRAFCDKTNLDCKSCGGDSCNKESQRDGTKCHKCSGSDCLIISTASTIVDCLSSCYVGINCKITSLHPFGSGFHKIIFQPTGNQFEVVQVTSRTQNDAQRTLTLLPNVLFAMVIVVMQLFIL